MQRACNADSEYQRLLEEERIMDPSLETFEAQKKRLTRLRELNPSFDTEFYNLADRK